MKRTTYKGIEIRFSDVDFEHGYARIKFGPYIILIPEEDFNNLTITEE